MAKSRSQRFELNKKAINHLSNISPKFARKVKSMRKLKTKEILALIRTFFPEIEAKDICSGALFLIIKEQILLYQTISIKMRNNNSILLEVKCFSGQKIGNQVFHIEKNRKIYLVKE